MLGLPKGQVVLCDYHEEWDALYQQESASILAAIGQYITDVHHVGSTSVPNLKAKPVIDIAVALHLFDDGFKCIEPLSALGYHHAIMDELPSRHYWRKGEPRTHQIHMFACGDPHLTDLIKFRDLLRENATLRTQYSDLKVQLEKRHANAKLGYTEAKTDFISQALLQKNTTPQEAEM